MNSEHLSSLTDQELLEEAKKMKKTSVINAFLVGFLIGIIFFSVIKNTWGLLTLIPLFLIYKVVNKSKYEKKQLEAVLEARSLK